MPVRFTLRAAALVLLAGACGLGSGCGSKPADPTGPGADTGQGKTPAPKPQQTKGAPEKKGAPDGPKPSADEVTAEAVVKDVAADPLTADAKYQGKTIVAEGPVRKLYRRPNSPPGAVVVAVALTGVTLPGEPDGVQVFAECRPEDADKALALSIGQTVKLRGRCGEAALAPTGCVILSTGPDPALKVNLPDLAAEFIKDQKAAGAKYGGKPLTVTATVESKEGTAEGGRLVLKHEQPQGIAVNAKWSAALPLDAARFDAVKPGDRVTIKCRGAGAALFTISLNDCRLVP